MPSRVFVSLPDELRRFLSQDCVAEGAQALADEEAADLDELYRLVEQHAAQTGATVKLHELLAGSEVIDRCEDPVLDEEGRPLSELDEMRAKSQVKDYDGSGHRKHRPVLLEVHPDWAPKGCERFKQLVESGFYTAARFHRVIPSFIAQVGIAADPAVYAKWGNSPIPDDPVKESNKRGTVSFAMRGPDTRSCQIFFNYKDNGPDLDGQGFSPIAVVKAGMEVIDQLVVPTGKGPDQPTLKEQGNAYLDKAFPELSEIVEAKIL
ncbi:putative peptidyl-prolyl cis-trans isomerase [Symbiodinium microadriaticum]|uniref:Peptidyl-prolyl cis-trans isomerase n=1 Tax=Symbiodinium microadriaticum TaxID=2951 RepID=A0A1Q9DQL8_SYMMI|nr:putative peptidyl-prolyl cis-trans isomerase [Symbiodinium microadriaticum]